MSDVSPLEAIFFAALGKGSAEERSAYLEEACGGDADLRRRVEKMLAAQREADSFLESPAPAPLGVTVDVAATESAGTVIGPYKLLEQIGEGGMGTVWMAQQQEPVKRLVALKLIKPGMDSRQVLARFEAERQALALMDHPNIARVLDAGAAPSGRPYFVMELVKGTPITRYCDEHRLSLKDRLGLFVQVCSAVQHAHQKGIIHRDLKPSNVLVAPYDGKPVVKVIDFGVAKAAGQPLTEKTLITSFGAVVGTPEYMSPEQAELNNADVDTRSDIYSLGVLLYELLTGTTPLTRKRLKEAALLEVLRVIREEEPPRPSTRLSESKDALPSISAQRQTEPAKLTRLVRGELDWIVMKALEKDRSRRYETANGFAIDVQRYLADEPVLACPPSAGYRLRKFARRNKTALAVAGLLLSLLVLSACGIGWAAREQAARQARVTGQAELALEEAERHQNAQKWPEALGAANRAEAILATGNADVGLERRVRQAVADLELVRRLEEARLLRGVLMKGTHADFDRINRHYAAAFRQSGIDVEALADQEAADRLRARPGVTIALAQALDNWADCLYLAGNEQGSRRLFLLADAVDPEPWRVKVRHAAANLDLETLSRLARSEEVARQPPASLVLLAEALAQRRNEAVALLERTSELYPGDFWAHARLASLAAGLQPRRLDLAIRHYEAARALRPDSVAIWGNLGLCLLDDGQVDEAVACMRKAVELAPDSPASHYNLGVALSKKGKVAEAIACYRTAIGLGPKNDLGNAWAADPYINLGLALAEQGKLDEAIACYRKAIEIEPKDYLPHNNLGAALAAQKRLDEAIACYRKSIDLHPKYAFAHNNLGTALLKQGKVAEAAACFRRAIELDSNYVTPHHGLGNTLARQGKASEAVACFQRAIELDPRFVVAHEDLRHVLMTQGKVDEALAVSRQVVSLKPDDARAHAVLGLLLGQKQAYAEAVTAYRDAIRLGPKDALPLNNLAWLLATCPDLRVRDAAEAVRLAKRAVALDPKDPTIPSTLGAAHYRTGDFKAAITALEKSMVLRAGGDSTEWFFLAMAHWKVGAEDEARKWYERAVQWMEQNDSKNEELRRFRTEAEELLGINKQAP